MKTIEYKGSLLSKAGQRICRHDWERTAIYEDGKLRFSWNSACKGLTIEKRCKKCSAEWKESGSLYGSHMELTPEVAAKVRHDEFGPDSDYRKMQDEWRFERKIGDCLEKVVSPGGIVCCAIVYLCAAMYYLGPLLAGG